MAANRINLRNLSLEDALSLPIRLKVNGTYQSFTGNTFSATIWDEETDTVLLTATSGAGTVLLSTNTVANDTVTASFDASAIGTLSPGTFRVRLYWNEAEMTLLSGKLNFIEGAP
jgi:hypothetical protein